MISRILFTKNIYLTLVFFIVLNLIQAQQTHLYLDQQLPSMTPEIFAPEVISKENEYEFGSVFSKDGTEFFYGVDVGERSEIRYTRLDKNKWTIPKTIISHAVYGYNDPFLSPDEYRLYYISDMPLDGRGNRKDHDIWYSEKRPYGWSKPINAGENINTNKNEYYISFTNNGTMYFSSNRGKNNNFDIYASKMEQNRFQEPTKLSDAINTAAYEADVFVSPDESFVIFCATRSEGLGRGDLYISFKQEDGTWTTSKNMGPLINTKNHELCPFVTKDGKYFFYTSNKDIYWVDAKILDQFK